MLFVAMAVVMTHNCLQWDSNVRSVTPQLGTLPPVTATCVRPSKVHVPVVPVRFCCRTGEEREPVGWTPAIKAEVVVVVMMVYAVASHFRLTQSRWTVWSSCEERSCGCWWRARMMPLWQSGLFSSRMLLSQWSMMSSDYWWTLDM